jgi:Uma2 family endonuclease
MTQLQTKSARRMAAEQLQSGDCMTQKEFHRIYSKMPEDFKAELIGGIVYVASPLGFGHSKAHVHLGTVLGIYEMETPGVDAGDNATIILGPNSEPQPDLYLRLLPECGGLSVMKNDFIEGAPELVIEVAQSSKSIDLHGKRKEYSSQGVREYLVICLRDQKIQGFDLRQNKTKSADSEGIVRTDSFPGLWLDEKALLSRNLKRLMEVLKRGIDSPEHAQFVKRLAAKRK